MKSKRPETFSTTHRFEAEILARIDRLAEKEGVTRSHIINRVMREGIEPSDYTKRIDEILALLKKHLAK
jgi:metal-responsive CopG/Arc/MetJ family transcriptional regulator